MEVERAQEILESPRIINVTYRGKPVHIDEIYASTGYAKVHYEDGAEANAAIVELQEES